MAAINSLTKIPVRMVNKILKNQTAFMSGSCRGARNSDSYTRNSDSSSRLGFPSVERAYRKFYYLTDDKKQESYYDKKYLKNISSGAPFQYLKTDNSDMEVRISGSETAFRHQNMKQNRVYKPQHQPMPLRQSQQHVRFFSEDSSTQISKGHIQNEVFRKDYIEKKTAPVICKVPKTRQIWRTLTTGPACNCEACDRKMKTRENYIKRAKNFAVNPKIVPSFETRKSEKIASTVEPVPLPVVVNIPLKNLSSAPDWNCMPCEANQKIYRKVEFLDDDIIPVQPPTITQLLSRQRKMTLAAAKNVNIYQKPAVNTKNKLKEWQRVKRAEAKRRIN